MTTLKRRKRPTVAQYAEGILAQHRIMLSKAITLVESQREDDEQAAQLLLERLMPHTGNSIRVGITGPPGVGKSTFIEAFGEYVVSLGHRLAVLAIDPSSQLHGGSIMGDKTRMESLAHHPQAYIRPSASGNHTGGVGRRTREAMLLCEAAGYDVIFIETVGVGQSEVAVRNMTDFFLLLSLAGAGDELQGIKKGIMEMADLISITKADGSNQSRARQAKSDHQSALRLFPHKDNGWQPSVTTCSALERKGLDQIWEQINQFVSHTKANGSFAQNRFQQNQAWMKEAIRDGLLRMFYKETAVSKQAAELEKAVIKGEMPAYAAARQLLETFFKT